MKVFRLRAVLATSAAFSLLAPAFAFAIAANIAPHPLSERPDLDAAEKAALVDLDSAHMNAKVFAAMALPYKYGVTQMPCKAKEWQPDRGWKPAREPAGKVQWIPGPATKVFWAGIYGTCLIQSPRPKEQLDAVERTALECECNGWMPTY
jgi:hypothetical protein